MVVSVGEEVKPSRHLGTSTSMALACKGQGQSEAAGGESSKEYL